MIMFDTHMHTKFSSDSKMNIENAIKQAEQLNIGIITTEHIDLNYPVEGRFVFNPKDYFEEYSKYRSDKVLLGVELGMMANRPNDNKVIAENYPFDYIIGSVHAVDDIDLYFEDFYKGKSKKAAYEAYFKYMIDCLKTHSFIDSLGHIDYISRYARYEDKEIHYEDFSEHIDEVLKTVIFYNKALEVNTRRLDEKIPAENLLKIYKRFHELGGSIITVGSDAHNEAAIGSNFNLAREIADRSNLKIVYFKNRKPEFV